LGAGFHFVGGGRIHNVLVIAERREFGACLEGVLREHGYHVTIVESYGRFANDLQNISNTQFDLVIATNTSLTPAQIQGIVPDIRARHPHTRIIVLSGYCSDDFVADLRQKGIHGFLPLPFGQTALLEEVAGQLSMPTP
jgi:DNA-binding NtrC family response regulator